MYLAASDICARARAAFLSGCSSFFLFHLLIVRASLYLRVKRFSCLQECLSHWVNIAGELGVGIFLRLTVFVVLSAFFYR